MPTNSRFAVAVHLLVYLALRQDVATVTSAILAKSVNTNSVVIRRVLGCLRQAGVVSSQAGNGGGWMLTRLPTKITLREIYRAVGQDFVFALPQRAANPHCPVGKNIQSILNGYFKEAEQAMEEQLAKVTLADVMDDVVTHTPDIRRGTWAEDAQRRRVHTTRTR